MLINETYYGDVVVTSDLPFDLYSLTRISHKLQIEYKRNVSSWPMTIDLNKSTGLWELWFVRPVTDEEYVATVSYLPGVEAA